MADTVPQARIAHPGMNAASSTNSASSSMLELIRNRESQELVIAICGAIGSGTKDLGERIKVALRDENYAVETIKVSNLILELKKDTGLLKLSAYDKYTKYQDAGNEIRQHLGNNKLAAEAIADIISKREKYLENPPGNGGTEVKPDDFKTTRKVCYIIDQLKHPDEVVLLRAVYRQNFYLIGVTSTEKQRVNNLINQSITHAQADELNGSKIC